MAFHHNRQAVLLAVVRRYLQIHREHLRTEKEDEALHKTIVEMMGDQTRIELSDADGSPYILTLTIQERMRVNPTLLLAHYPAVYDDVSCLSYARLLHVEAPAREQTA